MKSMSFTTPVLIAAFTVTTAWGLGMLAVRSGAASTRTSLDLLRMNLRVARLHEELLKQSQEALAGQVETLLPQGSVPSTAAGRAARQEKVSTPSEPDAESAARPWPETAAEP
ncbi:MAG TPA: hypothetical protein VF756_27345 [Thermoanaerobaculia bacterium]